MNHLTDDPSKKSTTVTVFLTFPLLPGCLFPKQKCAGFDLTLTLTNLPNSYGITHP